MGVISQCHRNYGRVSLVVRQTTGCVIRNI